LPQVPVLPCSNLERRLTAAAELVPVSFNGHAGVLHRPADRLQDRPALLLCPALGRDARCAYRPLFLWANTLACLGFHVLRYDHRGEGDSQSLDEGADQWSVWIRGAIEAAEFVRSYAPTRGLIVGGLRVGATLAAATAQASRPDGLMLLAPFSSGQAWLRELKLAAAVQSDAPQPGDVLEVDGLRLSAATVSTIERTNHFVSLKNPVWRAAFLASVGPKDALTKSLGPNLTHVPFSGYGKLFKEAHLNEPPTKLFEQATAWLERFSDAAHTTPMPAGGDAPSITPLNAKLYGSGWIEEPVSFGSGLRGVLCLPACPVGRRAIIFGNTAGDPRAGVGGFATKACRALAATGIGALRFDFLGIGESATRNHWRSHIYETSRVNDFHQAADLLHTYGYSDVTVAGICAGGYHAVRAVLEDNRFTRAVAINSWLIWRPGGSLEVPRPLPTRLGAVFQQRAWSRLIKGEMDIRRIPAGLAFRIRQAWMSRRPDALCKATRALFAGAADRGARIGLIFGQGDAAMQGVEADFGRGAAWLRRLPGVRFSVLPGVDHPLLSQASQNLVSNELLTFLGLAAHQGSWRCAGPSCTTGTLRYSRAARQNMNTA
jgi:alpha-beta hydrolase superfamily lysophospholipase